MYRIGVDLGGTNIAVGIVNVDNDIIAKRSRPTEAHRGAEAIIADIASLCFDVCSAAGIEMCEVERIGIASPGYVDADRGIVVYANNLPFRREPIAQKISDATRVRLVSVANDANAAALGEAVAGAAKGSRISVMTTLGTGVGGGVIIDGRIFSGAYGAGAELGHMVIEQGGLICSCGRRGCWEVYSSATALIRMTREAIERAKSENLPTVMSAETKISGRTACDAMRAGDAVAKEVYDRYVSYLATGITNMINIFQPEVISLGGGISGEGQSLIDALLPQIRSEQYGGEMVDNCEIRIAMLGNDAGIIGAASL